MRKGWIYAGGVLALLIVAGHFSASGDKRNYDAAVSRSDLPAIVAAAVSERHFPIVLSDGGDLRVEIRDQSTTDPMEMRDTFYKNLQRISEKVFSDAPRVTSLQLMQRASFKDMRGQTRIEEAFFARIERSTANSINWRNIERRNIPLIIDQWRQNSLFDRLPGPGKTIKG